jgi:hypothetical protein
MSSSSLDTIMERWRSDGAFRDEMRTDPEGALGRAGIELSDADWATLRGMDWENAGDEDAPGIRMGIINPQTTTTE